MDNLISTYDLGLASSTTLDQTTAIQNAVNAAASAGKGILWLPGIYIKAGNISNPGVSWIGVNARAVEIRDPNVTSAGASGVNIQTQNFTSPVVFSGLTFTQPNCPANSTNGAIFADTKLLFQIGSDAHVIDCVFVNSYGACVLFQHVNGGSMQRNKIYGCFKDGFHITGTSNNILRADNYVESGGDDAFPVVGYYPAGGSGGQPWKITDIGNIANGVKFARAFAYIGCRDVTNMGSQVNGLIPSQYTGYAAGSHTSRSLYINTETGSFTTFGCQNILVSDFQATDCGAVGNPGVYIGGSNASEDRKAKNIQIHGAKIKRSALDAIYMLGATTGDPAVSGVDLIDIDVEDTTDPNNWLGLGAGGGGGTMFTAYHIENLRFRGRATDTGQPIFVSDPLGDHIYEYSTTRANASSVHPGSLCRLIDVEGVARLDSLDVRMTIKEQAQVAAASTQYYVSNLTTFTGTYAGAIKNIDIIASQIGAATLDKAFSG